MSYKDLWRKANLNQIIFIDIETISQVENFADLNETFKNFWIEKKRNLLRWKPDSNPEQTEQDFYFENAGLYAEFGKVVCVSVGCYSEKNNELHLKSFANFDEFSLLNQLSAFLNETSHTRPHLCGHNVKEFDIPYLCRRMLINTVEIPPQLDLAGFKSWDVPHIDTMELWKFGDQKSYTKLDLILETLGISSPKDEISGSDVNRVFWKEKDLAGIVNYCEKDVIAVAQLLFRFRNLPPIREENIIKRKFEI